MKKRVCVYAICKNEEKFVDRFMDSMEEADLVVVLDTGSTDRTVAKLKARGAYVYQEKIEPWRFDVARNRSLSYIPEDIDICACIDLDEVFEPGWREKLEAAWNGEFTRAEYWFVWSHKEDGTPDKVSKKEKIHRRKDFKWVHPVHEVLKYEGAGEEKVVFIDDLFLHHYPDNQKSRGQYLPLLELSAAENPGNSQIIFWLGREYMYYNRHDECIRTLENYLALPSALWEEERSAAMRYIADSYRKKGDESNALRWLYQAIAECSYVREPWVALAKYGYEKEDWPLTFWAVEKGLAIKQKTNSYLTESISWGYLLDDLGAISCYRLEMYDRALNYAEKACKLKPEDERLQRNKELIAKKQKGGI